MMTKDQVYEIWAPDAAVWSPWVKPVLFAHLHLTVPAMDSAVGTPDLSWAPGSNAGVALVLDLPGDEGIWLGVALASRGYRPVPLYNALPIPSVDPTVNDVPAGQTLSPVNVLPIINALERTTETLAAIRLPSNAPPVFLLDANRRATGHVLREAEFDNRSICFTTDFPSANFLAAHGIQNIVLVQRVAVQPQSDLAHILRRWQDAGLTLKVCRIDLASPPERLEVPRPSWYGAMFQRVLSAIGLRRAAGGGFGAWHPASSGGG